MPLQETLAFLQAVADNAAAASGWAVATISSLVCMIALRISRKNEVIVDKVPRELRFAVNSGDPDAEARAEVLTTVARAIARDNWSALGEEIGKWEEDLRMTPSGKRFHEIAAEACLAPLEETLDRMERSELSALDPARLLVRGFEQRHRADPGNPALAAIAARASLILAENCHADFWPDHLRSAAWRRHAFHTLQAETILGRFDAVSYMSPLLAEAAWRLALGMPDGDRRIDAAFQDWIDLDPSNPAIYEAHMPLLLLEGVGSPEAVLEEAERAEARTADTLGRGGYALAMLPLLDDSEQVVRSLIDDERMAQAMEDLASHSATQAEVNWIAGRLLREVEDSRGMRADVYRRAFERVARQHLAEIFPHVWGRELAEVRAALAEVYAEAAKARVRSVRSLATARAT